MRLADVDDAEAVALWVGEDDVVGIRRSFVPVNLGRAQGDQALNLTRLIEIFGRPPRSAQPRLTLSSGPFRLADLRKAEIRGTRG